MDAKFNVIDFNTWVRKPYFEYYNTKVKCKYTLNHNVDITAFIAQIKDKGLKFFPSFLYIIICSVNKNKEFRMSYNNKNELGYWNYLVPSYTIFHKDDNTFSDIWSEYSEDFATFYNTVINDILKYKYVKGIKARENQPANFCPISSVPWLSFSSFAQDTYEDSKLLFPLIRFGKYYVENNKTLIPLSIFVNHSIADGYHTCKLINDIQDLVNEDLGMVKIE